MKALTDAELAAHSNACRASGVIDEREWWYGALRGTTEAMAQERPDEKALITEHDATVELNARRDERAQVTVKLDELRAQRDAAGAAADTNAASLEQCESRARVLLEDNERLRAERDAMSVDEKVKHMVNRFLAWRLPENFRPDSGVSFNPRSDTLCWPTGTNLLDATQTESMVRHMVEGLPSERDEARATAELHRVALAAAQAREVALREALTALLHALSTDPFASGGVLSVSACAGARAALAQPADDTALREFGRKCIEAHGLHDDPAATVAAVLSEKGRPCAA